MPFVPSIEMMSPSLSSAVALASVLVLGVDAQPLGTADARLAHAAGDHGGVRRLAAMRCEDALSGDHAVESSGVVSQRTRIDLCGRPQRRPRPHRL